jgi:putative transposase
MPRTARAVVAGIPYHITHRGNRGDKVFFRTTDYDRYLTWLDHYSRTKGLQVYAYCLMTNHIHVVCVPEEDDSLAGVFHALQMRYAQRVNRRRGWKGHLWQGRYFSSALDETYLLTAVRYVEQNPVRAGLVERAEDYEWSSAAPHCGARKDLVLSDALPLLREVGDWSKWLRGEEDSRAVDVLRRNTQKGIPCGSEKFVSRLEAVLERFLRFRPQGRPLKPNGSKIKGKRPLFL